MARKKKAFRSRPRTGMAAAPTKSFSAFSDYVRCEVEKKEISGIIKDFFKKTLNKHLELKMQKNGLKEREKKKPKNKLMVLFGERKILLRS